MKLFQISLLAVAAFALSSPQHARATTAYALTNGGDVLTFDHTTPGTITNDVAITGLGGYELLAIDVRPTVQAVPSQPGIGSLWGIGKSGTNFQLFVIDPVTGAATAIGVPIAAGISSVPANTEWGFDFNPIVDRIRLVNSSGADNYRLNPNNGTLDVTDVDLAYAAGDVNFGLAPSVDGGAYTTAGFGGTTSLFYIDSTLDILVASAAPNSGQLQTVGALGINITQPNGFDIYNDLTLLSAPVAGVDTLYSVNRATGAATLLGAFPLLTGVRGLAISISDPVDQKPVVQVIGKTTKKTKSSRYDLRFRATDDGSAIAVSFRQVRQTSSFKAVQGNGGIYTAKLRRLKFGNNPVSLRAIDSAGQQATVKAVIRRDR